MAYKVFDQISPEEWQDVADRCEYATFFHTPLWFKVFEKTYPGAAIATKKFSFDNGKIIFFPLIEQKTIRGLKKYMSAPAGCYGGWICADHLLPDEILEMTGYIFEYAKNLIWRANPLERSGDLLDRYKAKDDTTEILFLHNFKDEEALKGNYKHSVRKQISKGVRADLSIKVANSWEEWERYLEIYRNALKKWGSRATSRYPAEFFKNIYELDTDKVKLWLVIKESNIIGGNLNFYQSHHCVEWHAAYDDRYLSLGSRNFLVHNVITDATQKGYSFYDFNPSGGHEGTRVFKQTFGTTSVPANLIIKQDMSLCAKMFTKLGQMFKVFKKIQ
jgi:hypothetical protein